MVQDAKNGRHLDSSDDRKADTKPHGPYKFMEIILTQVRPEDYTIKGPKN